MFNQPYFVIMYDVHMLFSSTHQSNNNAISRPDFLIIKYHDPSSTDSFSRLRKINLKSSQMPTDIAQTLQNPSLKKCVGMPKQRKALRTLFCQKPGYATIISWTTM